jgi:hypothetical protein
VLELRKVFLINEARKGPVNLYNNNQRYFINVTGLSPAIFKEYLTVGRAHHHSGFKIVKQASKCLDSGIHSNIMFPQASQRSSTSAYNQSSLPHNNRPDSKSAQCLLVVKFPTELI